MASVQENIINDVVTRLNAATFTTALTASKRLFPRFKLENITATIVDVYPGPVEYVKQDRAGNYLKGYEIRLVLLSPLTADTNAALSPFLVLSEEIKNDLAGRNMAGLPLSQIDSDEFLNFELVQTAGLVSIEINLTYQGI